MTPEQLLDIMPRCPDAMVDTYAREITKAMATAQINTVTRAAMFLGQLAWESGELRYMEEIADGRDYEGREDLGNTHKGDGPRYKGRGPIQLTGRANYHAAGRSLSLPLESDPELAATAAVGFRIAAWYWTSRGCNTLADSLDFRGVTKAINGGHNHINRRLEYYYRALEVLGMFAPLGAA